MTAPPSTLADVFLQGVENHPRPDSFLRKSGGSYRPVSTEEFAGMVRACAGALAAAGIARGDRVAIVSYNRVEWAAVDYACQILGAPTVPIYTTLPADACAFILEDSGARAVFAEGAPQLAKVKDRAPLAVCFEAVPGAISFEEFLRRGAPAAPPPTCGPEDLATLIYTSGTTGRPKGVMLTHRNFVSNMLACCETIRMGPEDTALSFLPLSHAFERLIDYALFWKGARIAYAEQAERVSENLREVRPTIVATVPRLLEKLHARIAAAEEKMGPLRRAAFRWARAAGAEEAGFRRRGLRPPALVRWRFALARKLALDEVAELLGGRLRFFISGGAPLAADVAEFVFSLGLTVLEGYGLTETSPVLSVNRPEDVRIGTVGRPLPGVEIRIAPDGEILARGPNVMKGYWNLPSETEEALKDGWFHTGDVGELDADGFLRITDRKKDLIKTAGGKYVAPQPIENRLRACPLIRNAVVVGESRKYLAALIVPSPGASPDRIQAEVDAVNRTLAPFERIRKFALLERDFSMEEEEITPTLKVRRRQIEKKHLDRIRELYPEDRP